MTTTLSSETNFKASKFINGNLLKFEQAQEIWEHHALYHPEEGGYEQCIDKVKELLDASNVVVTTKFVIIETTGIPEGLDPAIARFVNFVHQGTKVIGSLDRILFIPDWCVPDTELLRHQLAETYVPLKLDRMTFIERFKFNTSMVIKSLFGDKSFDKAYMKMSSGSY